MDFMDEFRQRMDRELLKAAVCREIFCGCGNILDVGDAVMVETQQTMFLFCGKCYRESRASNGKTPKEMVEVYPSRFTVHDGKVLSKKTRMPKCKFPKDMRPDPLKMGFLTPTEKEPRMAELDAMLMDSVCEATDGCTVEADGKCEHGHVSWLRYFGIV